MRLPFRSWQQFIDRLPYRRHITSLSRRERRRRQAERRHTIEALEPRLVMNAAPVATADEWWVVPGAEFSTIAVAGVLANDTDADEDPLAALLAEGGDAAHGTLDLNSDGSFSYTPDTGFTGTDTFSYIASDGTEESDPVNVTLHVNTAPTLSWAQDMPSIPVNSADGAGVLVSSLIPSSALTDANSDPKGIAVIDADNDHGQWEYSLDDGETWSDMPSVGNSSALLLSANSTTRVRFTPDADFLGSTSLEFRGWDGRIGANGETADASNNGGARAISSATKTSTQRVLPTLSVSDETVDEDAGTVQFTVTLSHVSAETVTVQWTPADGSAVRPADWTSGSWVDSYYEQDWVDTSHYGDVWVDTSHYGETVWVDTSHWGTQQWVDTSHYESVWVVTGGHYDEENNWIEDGEYQQQWVSEGHYETPWISEGHDETPWITEGHNEYQWISEGHWQDGNLIAAHWSDDNTLTFTPGQTTKTFTVGIVDDEEHEDEEDFHVTLSSATSALIADPQGTATIVDNDPLNDAPTISLPAAQATPEGTALVLSAATNNALSIGDEDAGDEEVEITLSVTHGELTLAGLDDLAFTAGDGTADAALTFRGTVAAINAALDGLSFAPATNYVGPATLVVNVDDLGNTGVGGNQAAYAELALRVLPLIAISGASTAENDGPAQFTVTLSHASDQTVTVHWTTEDDTADDGDYVSASGTLTFEPGQTSKTVDVELIDDERDEPNQAFNVVLSNPTNAVITTASAVGTILDDEALPTLSIADLTVNELDGTAQLTVTLSAESEKTVMVNWSPADGSAIRPEDWTSGTWVEGYYQQNWVDTSHYEQVWVDTSHYGSPYWVDTSHMETVWVDTSHYEQVWVDTSHEGTPYWVDTSHYEQIWVDDHYENGSWIEEGHWETPWIEEGHYENGSWITEGHEEQQWISEGHEQQDWISEGHYENGDWITEGHWENGDWVEGYWNDFHQLTFEPGETTKTINIGVVSDLIAEDTENFFVNLSSPANATIADSQGEVTIHDVRLSLPTSAPTILEDTSAIFATALDSAISLSGPSDMEVSVTLSLDEGALTLGGLDGITLTTGAGMSDSTVTFRGTLAAVNAALDGLACAPPADFSGSVTLSLSVAPASGGFEPVTSSLTIAVLAVNDRPAFTKGPSISLSDATGMQTYENWASSITAGAADEGAQNLAFSVVADNPSLFAVQPTINAAGTLTFTPNANVTGATTVVVNLQDNGGNSNGGLNKSYGAVFTITLSAPPTSTNHAPFFIAGPDHESNEDAGAQTISDWVVFKAPGPASENDQSIEYVLTVDSENEDLFSEQPNVSADGTLRYTAAANEYGTATVTIYARDNGGTANGGADTSLSQSFTITVHSVNDAPSFTKGTDQAVEAGQGRYVANWATDISAGPENEGSQALEFIVETDHPELFSAAGLPTVTASGALSFTARNNVEGTATVTVRIKDSGGTERGGIDTSEPQTFTIEVEPADIPVDPSISVRPASITGADGFSGYMTEGSASETPTLTVYFTVAGGPEDIFRVDETIDIDWGDGTTDTVALRLDEFGYNETAELWECTAYYWHVYGDNSPINGEIHEPFTISVDGDAGTATTGVGVDNVDPSIGIYGVDGELHVVVGDNGWLDTLTYGWEVWDDYGYSVSGGGDTLPSLPLLGGAVYHVLATVSDDDGGIGYHQGDLLSPMTDPDAPSNRPRDPEKTDAHSTIGIEARDPDHTVEGGQLKFVITRTLTNRDEDHIDQGAVLRIRLGGGDNAATAADGSLSVPSGPVNWSLPNWTASGENWYMRPAGAAPDEYYLVLSGSDTEDTQEYEVTFSTIDDTIAEWDENLQIEILEGDAEYPEYEIVSGHHLAVGTIYDNDNVGDFGDQRDFNADDGLARDTVSNGVIAVDLYGGQVSVAPAGVGGVWMPSYHDDDNSQPLVEVTLAFPDGAHPETVSARLTVADIAGPSVSYDMSAFGENDGLIRFVVPGSADLVNELATGRHNFSIVFTTSSGTMRVFGTMDFVNRVDDAHGETQFGQRWTIDGVDRIYFNDAGFEAFPDTGVAWSPNVTLMRADGTSQAIYSFGEPQSAAPDEDPLLQNTIIESGTATRTWTFSGLKPGSVYYLAVSNSSSYELDQRSEAVSYAVTGGERIGGYGEEATINQRIGTDTNLGFYYVGAGGTLTVTLNANAAGGVIEASGMTLMEAMPGDGEEGDDFYDVTAVDGTVRKYDGAGLLRYIVDRNGNQAKLEYEDVNNDGLPFELVKVTQQGGFETSYAYSDGYLTTITDFAGRVTTFEIVDGELVSITGPDTGSAASAQSMLSFSYGGPGGQLSQVTLHNASVDPEDLNETAEANQVTVIGYGAGGRVNQVTNADGAVWHVTPYLLDGFSDTTSGAAHIVSTGDLAEDGNGQARATYTDARGHVWTYQMDSHGLTTARSAPPTDDLPERDVWLWERNSSGYVTRFTQPAGGAGLTGALGQLVTRYEGTPSRPTEIRYADGSREMWEYGAFGLVTKHTDPLGRVTIYDRDEHGNVLKITEVNRQGADRATSYTYSDAPESISSLAGGLAMSVTVGIGLEISREDGEWVYSSVDYGDAVMTRFDYYISGDSRGLLERVTRGYASDDPAATEYEYDARRNLVVERVLLDAGEGPDRETVYGRDHLGRLLSVTTAATEDHDASVTKYEYDAAGNRIAVVDPRSDAIRTLYTYDGMNRLRFTYLPVPGGDAATDQAVGVIENIYDENGNLTEVVDPLLNYVSYAYDARNQRTSLTQMAPGVTLVSGVSGADLTAAPVTRYEYDALGNLTAVIDPRSMTETEIRTTFAYDKLGRAVLVTQPATDDHGSPTTRRVYDQAGQLRFVYQSGVGATLVTYLEYDEFGRLVTQVNPAASAGAVEPTVTYQYDLRDNVRFVTSPRPNPINNETVTTEYQYDGLNRRVLEISPDPDGRFWESRIETETSYNDANDVTKVVVRPQGDNAAARATTYEYHADGTLSRVTLDDPDGAVGPLSAGSTAYHYDLAGNVLRVDEFFGETLAGQTEYEYDAQNRVWHIAGPSLGFTQHTKLAFNLAGEVIRVQEGSYLGGSFLADSLVTTYEYDALGRVHKTTVDPGMSQPEIETYNYYDASGNLRFAVDPRGFVTEQQYDALGRRTKLIEPATAQHAAPTTTWHYNIVGAVVEIDAPLDRVTNFVTDRLGRVTQTLLPVVADGRASITTEYDLLGNVIKTTDAQGVVSENHYDTLGRLITVTHGQDYEGYQYNAFGQVQAVLLPDGDVIRYEYDRMGREIFRRGPMPGAVAAGDPEFEHAENLKTVYSDNGSRVVTAGSKQYKYDAQGVLYELVDGTAAPTNYAFDVNGRLTSVTDALENNTSYVNDGLGRVLEEHTWQNGQDFTRTYGYDLAGNLVRFKDRNGRVTVTEYDANNRPIVQRLYADAVATIPEEVIETVYDAAGRMRSVSDSHSAYTFDYDALDRVTVATADYYDLAPVTLTYRYSDVGQGARFDDLRTSVTATIDGELDFVNEYRYDTEGRVTRVTQSAASGAHVTDKRVDFKYLVDGRLDVIARSANLSGAQALITRYGYDVLERLASLQNISSTGQTLSGYRWEYDSQGRVFQAISTIDGATTYAYDNRGQVLSVDRPASQIDESFSYDAAGNWTKDGFETGDYNRLTTDGVYNYSYDAEGNRIRAVSIHDDAVTEYDYDYRNRLVRVTERLAEGEPARLVVEYTYDVFDRLIEKRAESFGVTPEVDVRQWYVYDGRQLVLAFGGEGSLTNRYLYAGASGPLLADEQITQERALWTLADHQGTARDLVSFDGQAFNHRTFDAFGRMNRQTNGAVDLAFGYLGGLYDEQSRLLLQGQTFYDPVVGRFLGESDQADPNRYRFFGNDPNQPRVYASQTADESWGHDLWHGVLAGAQQLGDISGYAWRSVLALSQWSGEEATGGTVGISLVASFTGADAPIDISNVIHDLTHWEWSWGHVGNTLLNVVAILPVVGMLKNLKYLDEVGDAFKTVDRAAGSLRLRVSGGGRSVRPPVGHEGTRAGEPVRQPRRAGSQPRIGR